MTDLETILSWFQTADMPTEEEFKETFSSFRLKNTKIPIAEVDKLESLLNSKINADDYVKDGKIRADKIEALGLTELIESSEKDISGFAENSDKYEFQQNDFIAIPDDKENFSLFIFKGGEKSNKSNYLPTGLTNIMISMVEGLQMVLDSKLSKPTAVGNYFINHNTNSGYRAINPTANYLLFWNNTDFLSSDIYNNFGKYGIGTTTPSEMLHLNNGRIRAKAMVFDENSEILPYQITHNNRHYYGSDLTGASRLFMYGDFADYKALWQGFTEPEKTEIKTLMNGGWTTNTMSVYISYPRFIKSNNPEPAFITLIGANLNLPPTSFTIEILNSSDTVVATIDNSHVSLTDSNKLNFWDNTLKLLPLGIYKIRLWNGAAYYIHNNAIEIKDIIDVVDLSDNVWTIKTYNDKPYDNIYTLNDRVNISIDVDFANNMPNNGQAMISALSKSYVTNQDNFIINIGLTCTGTNPNNDNNLFPLGLTTTDTPNLFTDMFIWMGYSGSNYQINQIKSSVGGFFNVPISTEATLLIQKQGSNITAVLSVGTSIFVGYTIIDTSVLKNMYFKSLYFRNFSTSPNGISGAYIYKINSIIKY